MSHLRKNDIVAVITGKDRGKKGKVLMVLPRKGKILVEGVNVARRHRRPRSAQDQNAGIVSIEKPLHLSKVQYFCNRCNRPVRLGIKESADGGFLRYCRRCREEF